MVGLGMGEGGGEGGAPVNLLMWADSSTKNNNTHSDDTHTRKIYIYIE